MPTDPLGLRADAPLFDAWLTFHDEVTHPMAIPGHKRRLDLIGDAIASDVPLMAGVDTLHLDKGVLAAAQAKAAEAWGVDFARLLVGGSTQGNQALALAVGAPGDRVVVARTLHRSLLLGLVLAGLEPVWVTPSLDPESGFPAGVSPARLDAALTEHPDAVAAFVGEPSYVGTFGDITGQAAVAHRHGVPLIVDAAWAAHFGFHPRLPPNALSLGVDAMVTSAHKSLPAFSQGALVLARTGRLDRARLDAACEATETTSPSGTILASVDAARALVQHHGELFGPVIDAVATSRARLAAVDGVRVLAGEHVDPMRLVVDVSATGADGLAVEADLVAQGWPLEMADRDVLGPMVTVADSPEVLEAFTDLVIASIEARRGPARARPALDVWSLVPVQGCSPRAAYFAPAEAVPREEAVGRIAAEVIAPYPPGVPVVSVGEVITPEVLGVVAGALAAGTRLAYAADPSLATIRVLAD